ncbi:multicopper oxidase domain-containing protein [Thiolapillus sp.]
MKRRDFLRLGSAGCVSTMLGGMGLLSWTPRSHAAVISRTFYITEGFIDQIDGSSVYFRGFSSNSDALDIPGEALIVQEGDTVELTLVNTLSSAHSFVIDGVVDSGSVPAGETRTVRFTVTTPGTYMYYDRLDAPHNRLLGLHGGLAVMPAGSSDELYPGSPTFVQQYFWIFHDIDPAWHDRLRRGLMPNTDYVPRYFTINGLGGRPPGAPGSGDPAQDAMHDPRTALHGHVGDRSLVRILNAGMCAQSVHTHGNHMEWLTQNGVIRPDVWKKDCIFLDGDMGALDVIYPFETPPDAWPPTDVGTYPMHLHSEMSQTAAGGYYMFGALTDIFFE